MMHFDALFLPLMADGTHLKINDKGGHRSPAIFLGQGFGLCLHFH